MQSFEGNGMKQVWEQNQERLKHYVGESRYDLWIKPLRVSSESGDGLIVLETPNLLSKEQIEKSDLLSKIKLIFAEQGSEKDYDVRLNISSSRSSKPDNSPDSPNGGAQAQALPVNNPPAEAIAPTPALTNRLTRRRLIEHFTFDRYIVGEANQFAHAAAQAVANGTKNSTRPQYNPLFIYGGVGLGKTHLLNAIGHQFLRHNPKARVVYASGEDFTNDVITALQTRRTEELRRLYRHECDLLLIDDIQFIADKDATQTEFFHVFDALHSAKRQIVLTCDKHPDELKGIEERIISRFEWGLTADVKPPDIETKLAILKSKAAEYHFAMPNDVMMFLAKHCGAHMRELEGALTKVIASSSMLSEVPTLDSVKLLFRPAVVEPKRKPTIDAIIRTVAAYYDVTETELLSKRKFKHLALARQVAMFMSRELTDASYPMIGNAFNGKDHTTVMYAFEQIKFRKENDSDFRHQLEIIQERISSS